MAEVVVPEEEQKRRLEDIKSFFTVNLREIASLDDFKSRFPLASAMAIGRAETDNIRVFDERGRPNFWEFRQVRERMVEAFVPKFRRCALFGEQNNLNQTDRIILTSKCTDNGVIVAEKDSVAVYNVREDETPETYKRRGESTEVQVSGNFIAEVPNISCAERRCTITGVPSKECVEFLSAPIPEIRDSDVASRLVAMMCGEVEKKMAVATKTAVADALISTAKEEELDKVLRFLKAMFR